jgi:excisionase family DNA binding protein
MSDYLTFEEAATLLNTPHSTMYRWLRNGKIPGHKLGRQWRFLRSELEQFRLSGSQGDTDNNGFDELAKLLQSRQSKEVKLTIDVQSISILAEHLIWDAVDHGATVIHLAPVGDTHEVRYRTVQGLVTLHQLPSSSFDLLNQQWIDSSQPLRGQDHRRLYLERDDIEGKDRVQVRYQRLETFTGDRLTLHIIKEGDHPKSVDGIVADTVDGEYDAKILRHWSHASSGLFLITGQDGSGKTTTAYCCLEEMARDHNRVIFSLEHTVYFMLHGVNQVSVDLNDYEQYRKVLADIRQQDPDVIFISSNFFQDNVQQVYESAFRLAEGGYLVMVQMKANSPQDALSTFESSIGQEISNHLVGVVWQELHYIKSTGKRKASYQFKPGQLGLFEGEWSPSPKSILAT